jgi:hypothetical protein
MKLPFCEFVFKKFIFPAPSFPAKLKQPAGKAKKLRRVAARHHHAWYSGVCVHATVHTRWWRGVDITPPTVTLMVACEPTPPLTDNQWREIDGVARASKAKTAALPMTYSVLA